MALYHCSNCTETAALDKDRNRIMNGIRDTIRADSKEAATKAFVEKHGVEPRLVYEIKSDGR